MMEMKLSSYSVIQNLAESISKLYVGDRTDMLERIIEDEGLTVFYDDYGAGFDGMTIYDDHFYIHINLTRGNTKGSPRERFTLAHELGHYFIDNHRLGLKEGILSPHGSQANPSKLDKIEREADFFASCLLMPQYLFHKFTYKKKFSPEILNEIKTYFNVSFTAAALRYKDIGNNEISIIYAVDRKIKWRFSSARFPYKYLVEKHPLIPDNTLMDLCFKREVPSHTTKEIWCIEWFNDVSNSDLQNRMKEYCIIHENKALSIIWR